MKWKSGEQARKVRFASAVLLGAAYFAFEGNGQVAPTLASPDAAGQTRLSASYGNLPLSFEANRGQSDKRVKFLARGQGYGLFLTSTEAVLSLRAPARHKHAATKRAATGKNAAPDEAAMPAVVVRMRPVGANKHPELTGLDPLPGTSNYFIGGDSARWQCDVPNYARVKYAGVYPGIDLIYHGNQRQLEYDLVVAPGADPGRITLAFEGVQKLSLDPEGSLVLRTDAGEIAQRKPVIYQDIGGERRPVEGHYVLRANGRVGFRVARYDTTRPLIIDPVLSYSTYLGGSGNDIARAIAVDSAGSAYVTGETTSLNFPGASGSGSGSIEVFVTKLSAAGDALVYSTYLGGSGHDSAYAIAVDSLGNAYVTGDTDSPTDPGLGNIPFPLVGPFQALYRGNGDAFVTKINAFGNGLVYSTYLGGGGNERGYGIAVDASFNAYVTGHTSTSQGMVPGPNDFPTVAPFQAQNGQFGSHDAFVTKFNAAGSALVYSTFLGGNGNEFSLDGGAIAVDSDGNAYVGGTTLSPNFPGAGTSTIQPTYGGGGRSDGFVVKFNAAGSALLYSTYLGGSGDDAVNSIAIDAARNAYVVGYTTSTNFPTASPLQPSKSDVGSGEDAFVAKLNAAGSALVFSTYLGGNGNGERAYDVAVDSAGNAYVSGSTGSTNFPTVAPIQVNNAGSRDAFISKFNPAGSALLFSTYLGGSTGDEFGYGIAIDGAGHAYVTGSTSSTNLPTVGPFQASFGGSATDAFVAKIFTAAPAGDFNGDGKSDIVWRNYGTGQNAVWYMNGLTVTGGGSFNSAPVDWSIVATGDFNGDGKPDLVWRNTTNGSNAIWYMDGLNVIGGGAFNSAPTAWSIVGAGDFSGDGKPDIVWRNTLNGSNAIWYMSGLNVIGGGAFSGASTDWSIVGVGDFNGDGRPDIVWRNTINGSDAVWYMNGLNVIGGGPFTGASTSWIIGAVGDFNGDGKPDIAWRNTTTGQDAIWFMDGLNVIGGGAFDPAPTTWSIAGPR